MAASGALFPYRNRQQSVRPIQLTVFEPRYLAMLDDALSGDRLIGIIQPAGAEELSRAPELYPLGCAGRIVQYAEVGDGRCFQALGLDEADHKALTAEAANRRHHGRRSSGEGPAHIAHLIKVVSRAGSPAGL